MSIRNLQHRALAKQVALFSEQVLIVAAERFGNKLEGDDASAGNKVMALEKTSTIDMTPDLAAALKSLWSTTAIQAAYRRRNEFQLNDSAR